jgi:hypothetical protein
MAGASRLQHPSLQGFGMAALACGELGHGTRPLAYDEASD